MSSKYLGKQFDIHTGGVDLIFPHHENEIAQSEAGFGKKPWVKYWMHGNFLILDKKMSKSLGNIITLQTLIDKGYDPLDYRYFCLTAHYRSELKFNSESLDSARHAFQNLKSRILEIKENPLSKGNAKKYERLFLEKINDDLNMPEALAVIWSMLKDNKLGNKEKYSLILNFDQILGLGLKDIKIKKLDKEIKNLVDEREKARKNKDFKKADEIRDKLKKEGIILEDTEKGVKWKYE